MNFFRVRHKKIIIALTAVCLFYSEVSIAAAPNDMPDMLRGWYDAVDLDGDNDYTNNPASGSVVNLWADKTGLSHDLSITNNNFVPSYQHDIKSTQRHGVRFNAPGKNSLLEYKSAFWLGARVRTAEVFSVFSHRVKRNTLTIVFWDTSNNRNRISMHLPWGGRFYFDFGRCCASPSRMSGSPSFITYDEVPYLYQFSGSPTRQELLQDTHVIKSDGGAGVFRATHLFRVGWQHSGDFYEVLVYEKTLNKAQHRILSSYLLSKWDKPHASVSKYPDVYQGDLFANGDYDFFVGGIGQDDGQQLIGTSQGLTITDSDFLTANNKYVMAGVNYLLTTPETGETTTEIPLNYVKRAQRTWYLDTTGTGGKVNLSFDLASLGISANDGDRFGLIHRSTPTGIFVEKDSALVINGKVSFNYLPVDGIYTIGKKEIIFNIKKTSETVQTR